MGWIDSTKVALVSDMLEGICMFFMQELMETGIGKIIEIFLSAYMPTSTLFYTFFDLVKVHLFGPDAGYLECVNAAFSIMYYVSSITLLLLFIFHLIIACTGPSIEKKDEVSSLCVRFLITVVCIASVKWFYAQIAQITTEIIKQSYELNYNNNIQNVDLNLISGIIFAILTIVLLVVLLVDFVKLILDVIEKYIMAQVLICTAPAAAATFISKATSQVFKNHFIMYVSTMLNLFINHVFLGLFCRAISNIGIFSGPQNTIFLIALLKLGLGMSNIIKALGMNTAQTGMNLLNSIAFSGMGVMGMVRSISGLAHGAAGYMGGAATMAGGRGPVKNGDLGLIGIKDSMRNQKTGNASQIVDVAPPVSKNATSTPVTHSNVSVAEAFAAKDYNIAASGNYGEQREMIKGFFSDGNQDKLYKDTGIRASSINRAAVVNDGGGDIAGTMQIRDSDGVEHNLPFSIQRFPDDDSHKLGDVRGTDGISRTVCADVNPKEWQNTPFAVDYRYAKKSVLATLSGTNVDQSKMATQGVQSEIWTDGELLGYNAEDELVTSTNLKTGRTTYFSDMDYEKKHPLTNKQMFAILAKNSNCETIQHLKNVQKFNNKMNKAKALGDYHYTFDDGKIQYSAYIRAQNPGRLKGMREIYAGRYYGNKNMAIQPTHITVKSIAKDPHRWVLVPDDQKKENAK